MAGRASWPLLAMQLAANTDAHFAAMEAMRSALRERGAELQHQQLVLEETKRCLAEENGEMKKTLKLNVGGVNMKASRESLTQFPNTLLGALFSGRWDRKLARDRKNRIFLDVDPDCFDIILEFLKLCKNAPPGSDAIPMPQVPCERRDDLQETFDRLFAFFGLTALYEEAD